MTATVTLGGDDPLRDLRELLRLMKDANSEAWQKSLRQIAGLLQTSSERAFIDQRFGTDVWPPRYPNQEPPFVNVAGIVADFNRGMNAPSRRFENRPALRDTGEMLNRLKGSSGRTFGEWQVSVGSDVPYAEKHQTGGKSTQPVTGQVKERLRKLLKRPKRLFGKDKRKMGPKDRATVDRIAGLRAKLGFLFSIDELVTEVNKRPFVGVTEEVKPKIIRTVEQNLTGKPWEA